MPLEQTPRRLRWFGTFTAGWACGHGDPIDRGVLEMAQRLAEGAAARGIQDSAAFPSSSGEILLAFTTSKQLDVEVYVRRDGLVDVSCEQNGDTTLEVDDTTEDYALELLERWAEHPSVSLCSGVDPELKREAAAVLKTAGLDVGTAIRLFLRRVVEKGGLPVELSPANPVTRDALRDAKAGKTTPTTLEDL